MGLDMAISAYFVIWWVVLFAILPLGVRSHHEAGIEVPGGGEPASPVNPNLKRKFLTTTWVSAVVLAVLWTVLQLGLIHLPTIPAGPTSFH